MRHAAVSIGVAVTLTAILCGCEPRRLELHDLVGETVQLVVSANTEHSSNQLLITAVIARVEDETVTLSEDGFEYPIPASSVLQVTRDSRVVYTSPAAEE